VHPSHLQDGRVSTHARRPIPTGSGEWCSRLTGRKWPQAHGTERCGCGTCRRASVNIRSQAILTRSGAWCSRLTGREWPQVETITRCGCGIYYQRERVAVSEYSNLYNNIEFGDDGSKILINGNVVPISPRLPLSSSHLPAIIIKDRRALLQPAFQPLSNSTSIPIQGRTRITRVISSSKTRSCQPNEPQ
jgi:hypothetical protein